MLLDTGVLYALVDTSDNRNLDSKAIMLRVLKGKFGSPNVLDYVILETTTLLLQRRIHEGIKSLHDFLTQNKFRILFVTEDILSESMKLTIQSSTDFLSLADSSQIVLSRSLGIDTIATFDNVLGNFFESKIGKGYFDLLEKGEKRILMKIRRK
ncbi:MAG: PIN domain-containing protein [archaeon]|nr:PIN domain-containing protein [archaeon]